MIPVVDLFAGAGGLTEGFASLVDADGLPVFQPVMSVEKDPDACETLRLRAFLSRIADKEPGLPWEYEQFLRDRDPRALDCLKKRSRLRGLRLAVRLSRRSWGMRIRC